MRQRDRRDYKVESLRARVYALDRVRVLWRRSGLSWPQLTEPLGTLAWLYGRAPRRYGAATTIVLADDHAVVRSGSRMLLKGEQGFWVIGEAGDVGATLRKVGAYKPSVLVLDLNMPGGSSIPAIPSILETSPDTAIVILMMEGESPLARASLRAGALAFVRKDAAASDLIAAVRAAATDHRYLDPQLGVRIAAEPEAPAEPPDSLTDRELEVLKLVALGYTRTEIARELHLRSRTWAVDRCGCDLG